MAKIAHHSSSDFMMLLASADRRLLFWLWRCQDRTTRDPTYSSTDQENSQPSRRGYVFVQERLAQDCDQHVSQRRRRKNVTQVGPGERGDVGRKESDQARD